MGEHRDVGDWAKVYLALELRRYTGGGLALLGAVAMCWERRQALRAIVESSK